ncbi:MAG: ribonuclease HI [Cyclobacteriaceae bacterium]|nr:ribonuclease HI [Cyclobacteriaceae bacterium]
MIQIFTDGAAQGNPGPGGYGAILRYGQHEKELSDGFRLTTNNRMELMAVIIGLEAIKKNGIPVTVISDSKYVVEAVEKGWIWSWEKINFKKKANEDLWRRFIPLYHRFKPKFKWIKGHAGHPENERCDQLAVEAAQGGNLKIDVAYEKLVG